MIQVGKHFVYYGGNSNKVIDYMLLLDPVKWTWTKVE